MGTPQDTGLQQQVYISAASFVLNPQKISEVAFRAETAERMANTFTHVDRPYVFDEAADVVTKYTWKMDWPSVNSADYNKFAALESLPGFFDFTIWKPVTETFSGDGSRTGFRLLRRMANTVLTPPPGVTWTAVTTVGGSVVANPTFGTADSIGTTPVTFGAAPAAGSSNISITYVPLYLVRVVSPTRDMAIPFAEARALTLEEI